MNSFFFWSGFVAWMIAGSVGMFFGLDWLIDRLVQSFWTKREFLSFVWGRLKAKRDTERSRP